VKRDFIHKDQLSEHDYLFDKSLEPHKMHSGTIMNISSSGNYMLFCDTVAGADITNPDTWIPAQPATDNQSSVKYRIGQTVWVRFAEGNFDFGSIIGLNRDYETPLNVSATVDVLHENSTTQKVTFDTVSQTYSITVGSRVVSVSPTTITITDGTTTVQITSSGIIITAPSGVNLTGPLTITGTLTVNGTDILATLTSVQSALSALTTLYGAHKHAVTTAPGTTGTPI